MATQGYRDWINAGRPYTLIRPAKAVQATLRRHGLTVYDYPNEEHQRTGTPEDHTPFSVTGWPGQNKRWKARALDVMPRSGSAAHRKENADIARQLIRDRDAGLPGAMWIKYLNWTDEQNVCRQERWMDAGAPLRRTTRSSTDKGHLHISGRSDVDDDGRADGYDPIARMGGVRTGDDDVHLNEPLGQPLFVPDKEIPGPPTGITVGQALAFTQQNAHYARKLAEQTRDELRAATVADAQRDQAVLAAINGLVAAANAAGGNIDAEPIITAVNAARDKIHADMLQLQQQLAAARAENQELAAALKKATADRQPDSLTTE